jgi:hypothetical protein
MRVSPSSVAGLASSIREHGARQPRLTGPGRAASRGLAGPHLPGRDLPSRPPDQAAYCYPWQKKILEDIAIRMVVWTLLPKIFREARNHHANPAGRVTAGSGAANGDIEVSDPARWWMDSRL